MLLLYHSTMLDISCTFTDSSVHAAESTGKPEPIPALLGIQLAQCILGLSRSRTTQDRHSLVIHKRLATLSLTSPRRPTPKQTLDARVGHGEQILRAEVVLVGLLLLLLLVGPF